MRAQRGKRGASMRRVLSLVLVAVAIAGALWLGRHDRSAGRPESNASSPVQSTLSGVTDAFRGGIKPLSYSGPLMP